MNNTNWWEILIPIALLLFVLFSHNACTAADWNDGNCSVCETRYEMRGASRGLKYYACPNCGNEVTRY